MAGEDYGKLRQKLRAKYLLDKVLAIYFLLLCAPVFLLIAVLIGMDGLAHRKNRGGVFYSETRFSEGKRFRILKFRTVTMKAVKELRKNEDSESITTCQDKTWAGRIILHWYLDELPQLINILRGEMSFVGPRPHVKRGHERDVQGGQVYRNYMRAGLLGIPQACKTNDRFRRGFESMIEKKPSENPVFNTLDGFYARQCLEYSIWRILAFDLSLIAKGVVVIFRGSF